MSVKVPIPYQPFVKIEQVIRISLKTPEENSFAPVLLPSTEPAVAQYSKTLVAEDFPTVSPSNLEYMAIAFCGFVGQNTATATRTIYWRMFKNGTSIANGSFSVSASYFYRIFAIWQGVAVGQTIAMKLWADVADVVNYDWNGFHIHLSRVVTPEGLNLPCKTEFQSLFGVPVWNGANAPGGTVTPSSFAAHSCDYHLLYISSSTFIDMLFPKVTYKLYRIGYGDNTAPVNSISSATATTRAGLTQIRNWHPVLIKLVIYKIW